MTAECTADAKGPRRLRKLTERVAQTGVDGGTTMIPMYFDFIAPGLCAGDLDGNWVLWLVRQRDFTLGGLIDTGSSPC